MKILIVDTVMARDPAQQDMYRAIAAKHEVRSTDKPTSTLMRDFKPDVVWLGVYHHRMPSVSHFLKDLARRDCLVLIDNSDNEEFINECRPSKYADITRKVVTSRYLPHEGMEEFAESAGCKCLQLDWHLDPARIGGGRREKDIPVMFVCTGNPRRGVWYDYLLGYEVHFLAGTIFGPVYYELLARTKVVVAECQRECLTQKYIEAAFNGCIIVGDSVRYPVKHEVPPLEELAKAKLNNMQNAEIVRRFTNEMAFIRKFEKVIHEGLLV